MQSGSRNRARGADVAFGGFRHQELRHFCNFSGPAWPMGTPPADSASWGGGMRRGARSCARALGVGSCACNPWSLSSARSQRYASRIAPSREHQRSQRGRIDINRPCPGFRQATGARGTLRRPRYPKLPENPQPYLNRVGRGSTHAARRAADPRRARARLRRAASIRRAIAFGRSLGLARLALKRD